MRAEGEAPEGIDVELLARDATRELAGLGPLGALLDDDQAVAIHVARPDYVVVTRQGQAHALAEPGFSSPEALARVLARLAHQAGEPLQPGESVVERRLSRGARLVAIGPPVSRAWSLTIRKARRVETSLDELARGSAMSQSMATFLEACVAARANVLVVGADPAVLAPVMGALLAATPPGEQIELLEDRDEIALSLPQVIPLTLGRGIDPALLVGAAGRLVTERLALSSLNGRVLGPLIDFIEGGRAASSRASGRRRCVRGWRGSWPWWRSDGQALRSKRRGKPWRSRSTSRSRWGGVAASGGRASSGSRSSRASRPRGS